MISPILASLDHNEAARPRAEKIEQAVEADDRFLLWKASEALLFDLRFNHGENVFHVELKDFSEDAGSDYLASILNGHLWEQVLSARELQQPLAVVVLGDDNDVGAAIRKAASRATAGHGVDLDKLMEYYRMVEGFEANCIALNVQVWRFKTDPWKRMLLRVRKILEGGDLSGFAPAPSEGERQTVGLCILAGKGIGPAKAKAVLEKFSISLMPKKGDMYLTDCAGIGEKLAMSMARFVPCTNIIRPKKSKAKAKEVTA